MPFLTARQIHNGHGWLPEGSVIEVATDGTIVAIHDRPVAGATFYDGILCPGFVNVHCHLELSHMKGVAPEHTGLISFLQKIPAHRNDFTAEQKKAARESAMGELVNNGVVAVGDIANTTDTLDIRDTGKLHIHTFIEAIGFTEANAARSFGFSESAYNAFAAQQGGDKLLSQSIVPHAPYSVSSALFRLIDAHNNGIIAIHNQESAEENRYYLAKEGAVKSLLSGFGIDDSFFSPTQKTSLQSYLGWLAPRPFIFVHNTYTTVEDIQYARSRHSEAHWCLCPNANMYIEGRLPDIDAFIKEGAALCIGTDSLASNHQLSILAELKTIKEHYPHVSWEALLTWATRNGARALRMQDIIGTIEVGKRPGIVQLTDLYPSDESTARPGGFGCVRVIC